MTPFKSATAALAVLACSVPGARAQTASPAVTGMVLEPSAYLGAMTAPVDDALATQLKMPIGVGVVVTHVDPQSKAAGVLKPHDVVRMVDDQLLVNPEQLSIITRLRAPGETVNLKVIRQGEPIDVPVELVSKELPPVRRHPFSSSGGGFMVHSGGSVNIQPGGMSARTFAFPGGSVTIQSGEASPEQARDVERRMRVAFGHADHVRAAGAASSARVVTRSARPGETGGTWTLTENGRTLTLAIDAAGARRLTVTDAAGEPVFAGPVDTDEQEDAIPADLRRGYGELDDLAEKNGRQNAADETPPDPPQ
jgi:hypothetical protein